MRHQKIIFVIGHLAAAVIFLIRCSDGNSSAKDPRGTLYAGTKACGSCHKDITQVHLNSHHYKTSGKVSYDELKKFIGSAHNIVYYEDFARVSVEEKHSQFFQSYMIGGKEVRSEQLDIKIGSGEKAQTYAYWKNEQLIQLPLTYFTALQSWTNSPGYPGRKPYFDRVILSRCLECHASYVTKTDFQTGPLQVSEKLSANSIIFGIDCERCHGPAAQHVQFHQANPAAQQARFITSIKSLTRQQQLDLCASCHSGNDLDIQQTMFGFRPGDTLANFYYPYFGSGGKEPDVHGKQMQLLQASKCFQQSTMTCKSCHDSHPTEETKQDVFIEKCMACHKNSEHALQMKAVSKNCINCHMPLQVSKSLHFNNGKEMKSIPYLLRTHRIAVYPGSE
ncbi:MAG TPA: multiheme c-type cytochrome, partial [Chitinophagaceae bacterium]|nr:multiheme c-type cytochrome [Chitinophagaceae bacterium]